ncbi:hypothetical protein D3C73_1550770 [compost metagenome]
MLAVEGKLARLLLRHSSDQTHDVVVVDDGGSKEHKLEIELLYLGRSLVALLVLLFLESLGRF